jgi:hypothetical protein
METMIEISSFGKPPVFLDTGGFDRIKRSGSAKLNGRIEERTASRIRELARKANSDLTRAIDELDHEWDIDRAALILFASVLPVTASLGATKNRKWLMLFGLQYLAMWAHASFGWSPPTKLLRRLGLRSQKEIDAEKYALKTLRGDFRH